MDTSAQLFRQIGILADDESSLKKILKYVNDIILSKRRNIPYSNQDEDSKGKILNDIQMAMEEAQMYKKGEIQLSSWDDFKEELDKEGYL